jgi:transposase
MLNFSPAVKLWYCPDPVDMRLGFDGLFKLVVNRLKADPSPGICSSFATARLTASRVLYWGGHGLCLWCQRREAGRYHFPDASAEKTSLELTAGQFQMILDGIDLSRERHFQRAAAIPA